MRDRPGRNFTLLDAMILVAGTAVGLGLTRNFSPVEFTGSFDPIGPMSPRWGSPWTTRDWAVWAFGSARGWFHYLLPLLVSSTATVLAIRLRWPRPRIARLTVQPGAVACLGALAGVVLSGPMLLAIDVFRRSLEEGQYAYNMLEIGAASAVASSWLILLVGGRWRAEPGWIDRSGRLLGVVWIAPIPLFTLSWLVT